MKKHVSFLLVWLVVVVFSVWAIRTAHAQAAVPWQVAVSGAHTLCTVTAGVTQFCFASDGLWWSNAGAAYAQLGIAGTPGVISVNGKTGVVTISATTTAATTLN
jgi:hypothetical protein